MNDLRDIMTKKELAENLKKAYELLEQSNKEKQQWKQCSHTLADALGELNKSINPKNIVQEDLNRNKKWVIGSKDMPDDQPIIKAQKALEQFKNLRS